MYVHIPGICIQQVLHVLKVLAEYSTTNIKNVLMISCVITWIGTYSTSTGKHSYSTSSAKIKVVPLLPEQNVKERLNISMATSSRRLSVCFSAVCQYPSGSDGGALGGRHPEGRQLHQTSRPHHPRLREGGGKQIHWRDRQTLGCHEAAGPLLFFLLLLLFCFLILLLYFLLHHQSSLPPLSSLLPPLPPFDDQHQVSSTDCPLF